MTSLRRIEGIDLGHIEHRFGKGHAERIRGAAKMWISSGVVVCEGEQLSIVPEHFLVSDAVIESFFA
jgi:coproporphyrinogen III oxidase-like Fe-S oxidoreductase